MLSIIRLLDRTYPTLQLEQQFRSPFQILIATIISQRTRDTQTLPVATNLFSEAKTPQDLLSLPLYRLQTILRPAGKQISNAKRIRKLCVALLYEHEGAVPKNEFELLRLPGVGRKTANIVLSHAFHKDAVAVDIHVHRITNRLGWLTTRTPLETEMALQKLVPKRYWNVVNRIFVRHGQNTCLPRSPWCSRCTIALYCKKVGVKFSR